MLRIISKFSLSQVCSGTRQPGKALSVLLRLCGFSRSFCPLTHEHSERMGIRKLFDGSAFLTRGLNELFTRRANSLQKRNVALYTKIPSVFTAGLYITVTATKSQAKHDDDKLTVDHTEAF